MKESKPNVSSTMRLGETQRISLELTKVAGTSVSRVVPAALSLNRQAK